MGNVDLDGKQRTGVGLVTNLEASTALATLANDQHAGYVEVPGVGMVGLAGQAAKILARRTDADEWTDEAARFYCAVTWAGSKRWIAEPNELRVFEQFEKE